MNVNRAVGEKRLFVSTALLSFASVYPNRFTEAKFCNLSHATKRQTAAVQGTSLFSYYTNHHNGVINGF